ncbi:DeoR/GlpR family DNA-binding transcription regulator [Sneathiella chinensis]|nr:DeoR/GlpR family DNA-binding transcription regulator [Sneathiella chinensis]
MTTPPLTDRQKQILDFTERDGFVTIERLAEIFSVSAQTVRRDIITLSEAGRLQRFHGGAGAIETHETLRLDYSHKENLSVSGKTAVARQAAALIPDGTSLYLDVGTTMEMTAKALNAHQGLNIFTNSMRVALALDISRHTIHVLGGRVAGKDGSLVSEDLPLTLSGLQLDFALIACSCIDDKERVMDFDLSKIAVKRAAMASATRTMLLATPDKFGRAALATIAPLQDFDHVIDGRPPST